MGEINEEMGVCPYIASDRPQCHIAKVVDGKWTVDVDDLFGKCGPRWRTCDPKFCTTFTVFIFG